MIKYVFNIINTHPFVTTSEYDQLTSDEPRQNKPN